MDKHIAYHKLCEAITEPGCPVCRLTIEAVTGYLDRLMYADVNAIRLRDQLRRSRGFCAEHARQVLEIGNSLGLAIIYKDVVDNLGRALAKGRYRPISWLQRLRERRRASARSQATAALVESLSPQASCPACDERRMVEDVLLGTLVEHLGENAEFRADWQRSEALCLPHFLRALELVRSQESYQALVETQLKVWGQLSEELAEYIRKNDYRFRHEGFGSEGDSWLRAVKKVVGEWKEPRRAPDTTREARSAPDR